MADKLYSLNSKSILMKKKFQIIILLIIPLVVLLSTRCHAVDTLRSGSYLINMGITPQTIGNGLKPYGLIYVLLKNYRVPIQWVINTTKLKDGKDLTHNFIQYRGGVFVIPFEYRTLQVDSVITSWNAQGVIGATSISDIYTTISRTFYNAPRWTMDQQNGSLAVPYFTNAGIPATAYGGSIPAGWKTPAQLGACDDIFVMPHADPTWATHNNLYYWNLNNKGNLWAACHAVSVLEQLTNPGNTIKMNFLTTTGLLNYISHSNTPSSLYTYSDPTHPFMQFMKTMDSAMKNGSERIYMPGLTSAWRGSTTLGISATTNVDIPLKTLGPVSTLAYGKGYGDAARGWVMYEAGHNHNNTGTIEEKVAAQRAFFNFSFYVSHDRFADVALTINNLPSVLTENVPVNISLSVPASVDLSKYTIQWTSSVGGAFSPNATSQNVTYTPPSTSELTNISVAITDACGRSVFTTRSSVTTTLLFTNTVLNATSRDAKTIDLNWMGNSNSIYKYVVERSEEGKDWHTTREVFAEREMRPYEAKDLLPTLRDSYFRLRVIYHGTLVKFSNVVKISPIKKEFSHLMDLKNPVTQNIQFSYFALQSEVLNVEILNLNGKVLSNLKIKVQKGVSVLNIARPSVCNPGTFFLRLTGRSVNIIQKIAVL